MQTASHSEILSYVALSLLPGIGPVSGRQLLQHLGSAEEVFRQKRSRLERIPGIGPERAAAIASKETLLRAEKELTFVKKHEIRILPFSSTDYPRRLRECPDAPLVLYFKGKTNLQPTYMISIVGTRKMSLQGRDFLSCFIERIAPLGVTVVSGLAYGIDIHAHKECLRFGLPTIGVTAHGMSTLYPAAHRQTAEKMMDAGGLLTEYPSSTLPERDNFPARNRIVAGIADATLVVESALRGGAMITAEFANGYNRDVFAVPGRATDVYSKGCNHLIRTNKAMLIESADDLVVAMNWQPAGKKSNRQLPLFTELNQEERQLVTFMQNGPVHLDELAAMAAMPVSRTSVLLLDLEFKGIIQPAPGKMFRLAR
ncbi:MAG: DNA-processing protein DprA [Bacteroidota bacterium]